LRQDSKDFQVKGVKLPGIVRLISHIACSIAEKQALCTDKEAIAGGLRVHRVV
jgi:hypothetical protein